MGKMDVRALQQSPHDLLMGMFTWTHAVGFAVGTVIPGDTEAFKSDWVLWLSLVLLFNAIFEQLVTGTRHLGLLKEDSVTTPTSRILYTLLVTVRLGVGWAIVTIIRSVVAWTLESSGYMGMVNLSNSIVVLYSTYVVLNPVDANDVSLGGDEIVPIREATLRGAVPGTVPVRSIHTQSLHNLTNIPHAGRTPHDDVVDGV